LRLAPEQFTCDKEKIFWTLAFFKDGRAAKWSENLFHQEADTGIFPIQSWVDFKQQFWSQFFPVNAEADAINTDPWTLVVKFRHGLKLNVQSQIATMPFGRPANTDLEAWYAAA